jgi:hypothetical protein
MPSGILGESRKAMTEKKRFSREEAKERRWGSSLQGGCQADEAIQFLRFFFWIAALPVVARNDGKRQSF